MSNFVSRVFRHVFARQSHFTTGVHIATTNFRKGTFVFQMVFNVFLLKCFLLTFISAGNWEVVTLPVVTFGHVNKS